LKGTTTIVLFFTTTLRETQTHTQEHAYVHAYIQTQRQAARGDSRTHDNAHATTPSWRIQQVCTRSCDSVGTTGR
jgi:hypothetical protein